MPRGPAPSAVVAEHAPATTARGMEKLEQQALELGDDGSASSSSTRDTSAETDHGHELDATFEDEETALEMEGHLPIVSRKRRRLARAKDSYRSDPPFLPVAVHQAVAPEVTLIILDWDDTLLPSTWLQSQGLQIAPDSALPSEEQKAELSKVARCVIQTLRIAKRLGHVTVITNGEKGWVELSCCKFLPEVAPLLEGFKISSARFAFEHEQPQSPIHWKRMAFRKEIGAFLGMVSELPCAGCQSCHANMVSVGDSMSERVALMEATEGRDCWTKSLKLVERPSPEQLIKQHELLSNCLRPFVDHEGSLDLCLEVPG